MATNKPRLTSYVSQENYDRLIAITEAEGISLSQALDQLLSAHFQSASPSDALSDAPGETYASEEFKDWVSDVELRLALLEEAQDALFDKSAEAFLKASALTDAQPPAEKAKVTPIKRGNAVSQKPISAATTGILGVTLAKRLGCNKSLISRHKGKADFPRWSRDKDPEGMSWVFDTPSGLFFPLILGDAARSSSENGSIPQNIELHEET